MNAIKPTASVGYPRYETISNGDPSLTIMEAELNADSADCLPPPLNDMWDGAIAIIVRPDNAGDDLYSLRDELEMFRRENDFDLD